MHDSPHRIRPMRATDLDAILGIQAASYSPSMQEAAAVVLARMRDARETCIVAEDGEGVCAYLFAYPSRLGLVTALDGMFAVVPDADTLYLHDLSVAPRAHRRGLGCALVDRLAGEAPRRGLRVSALVSVQDTRGFWEGMGYRSAVLACPQAREALAGYPGGAHYMARALSPAFAGPGLPDDALSRPDLPPNSAG